MEVLPTTDFSVIPVFHVRYYGINKRSGRSVLYDSTSLSTIRALIKAGFKILRTDTEAKFRPFVDTFITMIWAWISSFKRGAITHKLARQGEKVGPFSPKMFGEHNTRAIILGLLYSLVRSA